MLSANEKLRRRALYCSKTTLFQGVFAFSVCVALFGSYWDRPAGWGRTVELVAIGMMGFGLLLGAWATSRQLRDAAVAAESTETTNQ